MVVEIEIPGDSTDTKPTAAILSVYLKRRTENTFAPDMEVQTCH
jgi:hypothetical protein